MSVVNRKRGGGGTAASIGVDTTNFNQNLSALDDTVQKALDTLDNALGGGGSPPAANVITDTTNFNVDVQLALDTIDDFVVQGLAIYVDKRVITTGDGTFSKPFKTIQEGINAASANDLVIFAPGVYTEQITPKTNVTLLGLARLRCVIKYAANTIDFTAHTGAFVVRNCTILGEPAAGPQTAVMDFNGVCIFTQCTFNWSTLGGGTIPKITADNINTLTWVFMVECGSILPILIDDDDADTHSLRFAIWRLEQDAKFAIDTEDTANIELRHCSFAADVEIGCKAGLSTLILGHSEIYAAGADALTFSSTGGQVQPTVEQCALHSDQAALRFSAATETPVLTNNVLEGDTNDIVVDAGITVGVKLYENNSTPNGGVSCGVGSVFGLPGQKVKNVGATEDSFKNLASAVQSCTSGKHALQLHSDQTLAAQQALNSVALTIDGLDKFNVGGTDLFDLGDDSSLWLENIPLMQGRITVSGDNAHLRLRDTDLTGQTRVTGGDLSTLIELERSKWLGSGAWPIPLYHVAPLLLRKRPGRWDDHEPRSSIPQI